MGIAEVFSIFFILLMVISNISAMANDCSISTCGGQDPVEVRFPFRLQAHQPEFCGYPGFNLYCNSFGKTVLNLPFSGAFFVREINYVKQEIHLYDPDNCLPRQLLDFNLSESPGFKSVYYQNYTFLNCSSESEASKFPNIDCLSSTEHKVLATPSMTLGSFFSTECEVIKTVSVPVQYPIKYAHGFSPDLGNDLVLGWDEPDCRDCSARGLQCRLMSRNSSQTGCFAVPLKGSSTENSSNGNIDLQHKITLGIAIPIMLILMTFLACLCACDYASNHQQASRTVSPQPSITVSTVGLDGITIETYPKLIIGESCRVPVPNGNTCPICLSDYHSKEILRSMPDCKHCFHAECIDEWLLINATCPLCRDCPASVEQDPPPSP